MMDAVSKETTEKRIFANGLCFYKFFWIFIIGCVFGCLWEELLGIVTNFLETGNIIWHYHHGLIYGPFNPVYGGGAVLLTIVFSNRNLKWWEYILYGAIAGGAFEYFASYIQQLVFGTVSWDYSNMPLNINGRTNVPFMVFWGLLSCIWAMFVYPKLSSFIESWPYKVGKVLTIIFVILISIDIGITCIATLRQSERKRGEAPSNVIEELSDKLYPDSVIDLYFGNTPTTLIKFR